MCIYFRKFIFRSWENNLKLPNPVSWSCRAEVRFMNFVLLLVSLVTSVKVSISFQKIIWLSLISKPVFCLSPQYFQFQLLVAYSDPPSREGHFWSGSLSLKWNSYDCNLRFFPFSGKLRDKKLDFNGRERKTNLFRRLLIH